MFKSKKSITPEINSNLSDAECLFRNPVELSSVEKNAESSSIANKEENSHLTYIATTPQHQLDADVVLPTLTRTLLEESLTKIKYHKIIYEEWGFSEVDKVGRGNILNFYGPPGTGKTLTAEAYAGKLELPIIKLGIAELESKLMGETSKNIQKAFQDASEQGAVIFFDEADTLLGSRLSSVTQGVDNEINAMRSTMLIELEKFAGIVIFATNFAKNYDAAFRSRISNHIEFTLPDLEARKLLWARMLVEKIPLAQDRDELIELCAAQSENFSGREIRTCMRLALPKTLKEAMDNGTEPKLHFSHLEAAIMNVQKSQKEVGISTDSTAKRKYKAEEARMAIKILDAKQPIQKEHSISIID